MACRPFWGCCPCPPFPSSSTGAANLHYLVPIRRLWSYVGTGDGIAPSTAMLGCENGENGDRFIYFHHAHLANAIYLAEQASFYILPHLCNSTFQPSCVGVWTAKRMRGQIYFLLRCAQDGLLVHCPHWNDGRISSYSPAIMVSHIQAA
jgi:hypothetical protein